jgi:hypothetical protein
MSYWKTYEDPDYYDSEQDQDWPNEDEYRELEKEQQ